MSHKATRLFGFKIFVFIFAFACASAAQSDESMSKSGKQKNAVITGCVQKGEEPNGYTLKAEDGTTYELVSSKDSLGDHVGHTVSITGSKTHETKSGEAQKKAFETKEAAGGHYSDFKVSEIKMVSESCK